MGQWTACSASRSGAAETTGATEQDKKLKQYLEDERIALFLQNEEFMRELQRNREFLVALERGTVGRRVVSAHIYSHVVFKVSLYEPCG